MTWSWTNWMPAIRFRMSRALVGMVRPSAFSTARTEARAWTVEQTPQARWAKTQASRGSRPLRMSSRPRNMVPLLHASVTTPFVTSTSMRRCPSIRVIGSTTTRVMSRALLARRLVGRGRGRLVRLPLSEAGRGGDELAHVLMVTLAPRPDVADRPVGGAQGSHDADETEPDLVGRHVHGEPGRVAQAAVERGHLVPEARHRAADAAVARLDRPARPVVEADRRAVGERLRALAAHLVEAPALAGARVAPRQHVLAGVEVGPPLALVVEELAVGEERTAHGVSGRQTVEREVVDDRRGEVLDVHRAPGEVDHLRPRDDIGDASCPGWPAVRRWQPAVECARSDRDGQERVVADLLHRGEEGLAAHQAVDPSVGQRDRPFHDRDVLARVGGDGT